MSKPDWMVSGLRDLLRECESVLKRVGHRYDIDFPNFGPTHNVYDDLLQRIDKALGGDHRPDKRH